MADLWTIDAQMADPPCPPDWWDGAEKVARKIAKRTECRGCKHKGLTLLQVDDVGDALVGWGECPECGEETGFYL